MFTFAIPKYISIKRKVSARTYYCGIIRHCICRPCGYLWISTEPVTYKSPAINTCTSTCKRIAESCRTVRKNYHAFVPSGGIGRIKQLLSLVYARLLVRSAVIAVGFYRYRVNLAD